MKNGVMAILMIGYGICAILLWYIPVVHQNITDLALIMQHTPQILP